MGGILPLRLEHEKISPKKIQDFVCIDHGNELAVVGTLPEAAEEEIITFGGYYPGEKTSKAEVALVVLDGWQERGIGTLQAVMHKLDGEAESSLEGSVYSMRSDF